MADPNPNPAKRPGDDKGPAKGKPAPTPKARPRRGPAAKRNPAAKARAEGHKPEKPDKAERKFRLATVHSIAPHDKKGQRTLVLAHPDDDNKPGATHAVSEDATVTLNDQESHLGLDDLRRGDEVQIPEGADPSKPLDELTVTRS